MGFYRSQVVPWLLHRAMKNREATRQRRLLVPAASGRVLEIGIGSGLNLPFYGAAVSSVTGLEPSTKLLALARRAGRALPFEMALFGGSAEAIPCEDRSFDTLLSSWTLCSIADLPAALQEMRRVLRPGGRLLFIEHGRAAERPVAAWQDRLNPVWRRISGGCNIDRPIDRLIEAAGFSFTALERGYLIKGPRVLTYSYKGAARLS